MPWPMCWPAAAAAACMELTDRRAKPAVLFRRQVAHHRFRALQRAQLRHPPHRRRHAVQGAQPDPPPAARLELPARPSATRASTSCPPASASRRRSGTRARPTRSTRTSTSSRATAPKYMVVLAGDHIYKMDYELMLRAARRRRRRRDRRLPRGAAHGGHRLRRHACRRATTASSRSSKSRRSRPAMPGQARTWRWPRMGIYVFETNFLIEQLRRDAADARLEPRLRQGHHSLHRAARQGDGAPLRQLLRALERREASAYWRDVGTVDAYWEANIDLTDIAAGARPLRPRLADLDLCRADAAGEVRARRGRPARHGGLFAGLGRLHRLGRLAEAQSCCSPACASIPIRRWKKP